MFIKRMLLIVGILSLLIFVGCTTGGESGEPSEADELREQLELESNTEYDLDSFAQCLTDEGMVMYGAFWCPHCEDQKDVFGDAQDYLDYIECDDNAPDGTGDSAACFAQNIESYPTWIHPDGRQWVGVQSFQTLSDVTGCELNEIGAEESSE